jgi:hypothetical protein
MTARNANRQQLPLPTARLPKGPATLFSFTLQPDVLYRADELKRRLGMQDAAWRAALRNGLVVYREGRRNFVRGADAIAHICRPENLVEREGRHVD